MSIPCSTCKKSNITTYSDGYEASPRPFGSSYYYPTLEEFECFNPCKECHRACDICDEVGEIEPVICYYCNDEIANCQVFTCFNTYCSVTKCVKCARKDNSSGLCVDCFADMCDEQHEYMVSCHY